MSRNGITILGIIWKSLTSKRPQVRRIFGFTFPLRNARAQDMKVKANILICKPRILIVRRRILVRKVHNEKHKRKAHYPPCETSNERLRVRRLCRRRSKTRVNIGQLVAKSWRRGRSAGCSEADEEWKRGEEVGGTTFVKWYRTNEAIKSLASERARSQAAKVAGKPVMLSENYDVTVCPSRNKQVQ